MLTAGAALALFSMLAISSISLLIAQRMRFPHTVLLVLIGIVLAALAKATPLHFLSELRLTPELLFFIFLPTLIFEAAYNIPIRNLTKDIVPISLLAIVSLVISAGFIAFVLDLALGLIGFDIPFILSLLFGAIISATDPVAVLALFKEYGAPRRLSLIFEGESIFNDGTGVALFLVILAIAETGTYAMGSIEEGIVSFTIMVIGGIIFGLIFGGFFAKVIETTRSNEFASITLTMVLAHATFICAELFSHTVTIGGHHVLISSIIATATASLLMGNYGRYKMPIHASEFVEKYWAQFAFIANSLVFIMIGMLVADLPSDTPELMLPIGITILIVAIGRALSIYPILGLFNVFTTKQDAIPRSWQHVLAWGSLRGALAVTMVLMIPDTLSFPSWNFAFSPKEFVLALTVGCIFATLFIKATTIGIMMRRLKLSTFTPFEEVNYREMLVYFYSTAMKRFDEAHAKGYVPGAVHSRLRAEQDTKLHAAADDLAQHIQNAALLTKVIRMHALGIERKYVKQLYAAHEVSENVMKRIMAKLEFQTDALENDTFSHEKHESGYENDVFEYLADILRTVFRKQPSADQIVTERYYYYRALSIISRKVIKELNRLNECFASDFALPHEAIQNVATQYEKYRDGSTAKITDLRAAHPQLTEKLDARLAYRSLVTHGHHILDNLREREMVTPKVSIALHEHFEHSIGK